MIAERVQNEIGFWEQTENHLHKGIEDLTACFKREFELLAEEVLQLDDSMCAKPDLSKTRLGKSNNNRILKFISGTCI